MSHESGLPGSAGIQSVAKAALGISRVAGLTHAFYRYPARFSPDFARAAILAYSRPGDVILDPFMGGGTTAVESLALGRRFIGADINPISRILTSVKTTPLTREDASTLLGWLSGAHDQTLHQLHRGEAGAWSDYLRNVPWWLKRQIQVLLATLAELPNRRLRNFARCSILRTAQWSLDNRLNLASSGEFRRVHQKHLSEMLSASLQLGQGLSSKAAFDSKDSQRLLCRTAAGIEKDRRIPPEWKPAKLVVTSPPYPGVHVLYHRWQVQGRRETAAPFWIVGEEDGHPASFYTMGPRYARDLGRYLVEMEDAYRSIVAMMDAASIVVQLIGFSDPETQLGPVLDMFESVGLIEIRGSGRDSNDTRAWRPVPNRRWYTTMDDSTMSGEEVILVHRLARR
nr:site-specific DNA-methyltransferase [Ferrimicrobium acidiphilum]